MVTEHLLVANKLAIE